MLFNQQLHEAEEKDDLDMLVEHDPDSAEGIDDMAEEVEQHMTAAALEAVSYFEGGEEAVRNFTESAAVQALVEARKIPKKTFVRLNKNDDLQRRSNLACLVLAKRHKDPLWTKLSLNRVKERKLRNAIYAKYRNKANVIAKKSQMKHVKDSKKLPALPKITFN